MRIALLLAAIALTGCDPNTNLAGVPAMRCIDGKLYEWWNGAWVMTDGRGYMGRPDGPIQCRAPGDNGSLPK